LGLRTYNKRKGSRGWAWTQQTRGLREIQRYLAWKNVKEICGRSSTWRFHAGDERQGEKP
jgi:hypothetical protein